MVRPLTPPQVEVWLSEHGLKAGDIAKVIAGVDLGMPMYVRVLEPGERLVQYRDRPSVEYPSGDLGGQWFALPSIHSGDLGNVGIGHGLAGRSRHELMVLRHVEALETTARAMGGHLADRYRGPGGATQIFLPDRGLSSLG